jgi:hypothetical protein
MKQLKSTRIIKPHIQQELFLASPDPPANQSISVYRVSLVKDESVSFGNVRSGEFPGGPGPDTKPHPHQRTAR